MHPTLIRADRSLHTVAVQVMMWQPGSYAGALYAAFADALAELASLEPHHRSAARDRLGLLAERVGIVLPISEDIAGSAMWRHIGTVTTDIDPWHFVKVLRALFPQPSVQARVESPTIGTVALWAAMGPNEGRELLSRIGVRLRLLQVRRVVGRCRVTPHLTEPSSPLDKLTPPRTD